METIQTTILIAAVAAGQPSPTDDADGRPQGLYVKLSGAALLQEDTELRSVGGLALNAELEHDVGYGVHGAVGYTFAGESPLSVSLELEYSFRTADIDNLSAPSLTLSTAGTTRSHAIMVNALAAVDVADGLSLYGGGGIGAAITASELDLDLGGGFVLSFPSDEDTTFAWQVMGGVQYALGSHVVLFGGVRYFDAGEVSFEAYGGDNRSLGFEAGLRVYF